MHKRRWIKKVVVLMVCGLLITTNGCSLLSSQGIVEAMVREDSEVNTFYGEAEMRQYYNGELLCTVSYREWKGNENKYRVEYKTVVTDSYKKAVDNGLMKGDFESEEEIDITNEDQLIAYVPAKETYYIKPITLADEVDPTIVQGINQVLRSGSLKEYALELIDEVSKNHDVTIKDNVKCGNYTTQHIVAVPKEGKVGEATIEAWIDQNSWMVVKTKSSVGKLIIEQEYKTFTINPGITEEKFIMTIPEGAKVIKLDEKLGVVNQKVSLEEAVSKLKVPIFYIGDEEIATMKEARYIETSNQIYAKVEITYVTPEGKEFIIQNMPCNKFQENLDLGFEKVKLNNIEGIYVEEAPMKIIEFNKEGTLCDIYIKNSEMSKEELVELAKALEIKKNEYNAELEFLKGE